MSYRELGLFSIIISWGAFAYLISKWKGNKTMSLSLHAASARRAYYFFAAVLLGAGSLFAVFMFTWFIPEFRLPDSFKVLMLTTFACQFFTAVIPDSTGIKRTLHRIFAYTLAFLLSLLTVFILASCTLRIQTQFIGGVTIAYMLFCWIGFVFIRRFMKHYLIFQVAYIISFHIFILAAAYLG